MMTTEERIEYLKNRPNYVVIGKRPGDEIYYAVVEHSFAMGLSEDRALVFWSSENATSNFGGTFTIDGKEDAAHQLERVSKDHPDIQFEIEEIGAGMLEIDWEEYAEAGMPDSKKLSGVKDKFRARNARFTIQGQP